MNCFNHPEINAIGICKNCNKGICKDCVTEVENGIACTSTCVSEVQEINVLINKNKVSYNTVAGAHMRNAYLFGIMGLVFIYFGVSSNNPIGFLSIMGLIFIVAGILSLVSAKKYKDNNKNTTQQ